MKHKTKKRIYNVLLLVVIIAGISWIASKFIHLGNVEFTDNAQVKQLIIPVNARVQGYVKEIRFSEYQQVKKGDTLVVIENSEHLLNIAQARANLQNAQAGKTVAASSVNTADNNVAVSEAAIAEVKALLDNAQSEYNRYLKLYAQESVTQQEFDTYKTKYLALKAKYEAMQRQKTSASLVKNEQNTRLYQNDADISLAKARLDMAELNLSYTVITAPADGFVGRKNLQIGQLIQPGQTLVEVIDSNEKWIIANYRETQTHRIVEGAEVELKVDALPNIKIKGVVKSIANATGSSFSVLPQDNSAGNFVKVEQRIPVRIEFSKDNDPALLQKLRAGMNVEAAVKY
ncbi:MAG: HlyD family secretion protein [Flavobacteriia bacterium]|nr:HlyD family secretion protein [Flavobacteriia bacterium]